MTERPGSSRALDEEGRLRLECWYCNERIAYGGDDPCAVILVASWGDEARRRSQQFFALPSAFATAGRVQTYILDPDFEA